MTTSDSPWIFRSDPQPVAAADVAIVTDPTDGAALLLGTDLHRRFVLCRWQGERWGLVRADVLRDESQRYHGGPLAWVEPDRGVVLARRGDEALLSAPLSDLDRLTTVHVHGLQGNSGHTFAFGDQSGGAWLIAGVDNHSRTWRVQGDVGVEVARGPYLVQVAFDPRTRALIGLDVMQRGYRFADREWRPDPRVDGKLDTIAHDPRHDAIVGLRITSGERMDLLSFGASGWQPAAAATWLPTFRNHMLLGVDLRTRQLLAFGGQDFDCGGEPSAATWYGESGELRETVDPSVPQWGRYNTLLTARDGLLAFNHSSARLHRRVDGRWQRVGELPAGDRLDYDDRFLNLAIADDRSLLHHGEGELHAWRPGGALDPLAPESRPRRPGPSYSHRTAVGWDPRRGRPVVGSGDCGRLTHVAVDGAWQALTDAPGFIAGEIAVMATTSAGLYALARGGLRHMTEETWTVVADALPDQRWLGFEPRRGALLAADHAAVWLSVGTAWRRLAALPGDVQLGESAGQLGVDPLADELVLIDGPRLWTASLAAFDWTGAALPTAPVQPARKKRAR
jgi:hypothetical protein